MNRLIKRGCNFVLKQFFGLGFGKILHRIHQDKITIVSMHGVMMSHDGILWQPLREQLSPEVLERTIKVLSKYYTFICMDRAKNILNGSELPVKNGLVFTLDDGYWNNLSYAGAIFKKYGIKPTIFVATKNIDQCSPFWFDRLDYALQQLKGDNFQVVIGGESFSFDISSTSQLKQSYQLFRTICKAGFSTDSEMRDCLDSISRQIESQTGKSLVDIISGDDWSRLVSWQQLKGVSDANEFDVGSHTVDHVRISLTDDVTAQEQLADSKAKIESQLGTQCQYFCYPNGCVNDLVAKMVQEAGYELAVTTQIGLNASGDDIMTLKRFSVPIHAKSNDILYAISSLRVWYGYT